MIIQGGVLLLAVGIVQTLISLDVIELLGVACYISVDCSLYS